MSKQVLALGAQPCVWMCAGVLRYRLCTQEYDCDHCPLDAALRGEGKIAQGIALPAETSPAFPDDRHYGAGHTWLKAVSSGGESVWRLGLDAFAAAMVADARVVRWGEWPRAVGPGDTVCTLDIGLGLLHVRSPVRAQMLRGNDVLRVHPRRAVTDPYDGGWLVELALVDARELAGLPTASVARETALHDLRSFRRAVALSLLHDPEADRGCNGDDLAVHDLRWLLGGVHYVEFLDELVH